MTAAARVQKQSMTFRSDVHQDYINRSMHQATRAVNLLLRDGFVIEQVSLGGGGVPKIKILWHPRVDNLGETRVFSRGNNGISYETYLVEFEGCQLSWIRK